MATENKPAQFLERELRLTRLLNAPREKVFQVWTDERHLKQWWGPHRFTNPVCKVDARPDGAIHIDMCGPDGTIYPMAGSYQEIVEPELLIFTSIPLDRNGKPLFQVLITVNLSELNDKTELTVQASVLEATDQAGRYLDGMEIGWTQSLERLDTYLASQQFRKEEE